MRKLSLLFGLALLLSGLLAAQAAAKDITVFDTMVSGTDNGTNWYNRGNNPGEDQEVEPNCTTGKAWDLEGFAIKNGKLYTIGSYDFINGQDTYTAVTATDGPHNVICTDLGLIPDTGDTWFHLTQECGNDNLMGHFVPLPGAFLLLGAGLTRLIAYVRRRQKD